MRRQVSLEEISDGRLYGKNDMVRTDCGGCRGCSSCCRGMGNSVILDPLDIYRLTVGLSCTFEELMTDKIELNVVDGVILPNLKMSVGDETCAFLDAAGRCSIHAQRPGVCRLFPLGRYYPPADSSVAEPGAALSSVTEPEAAGSDVAGTDHAGTNAEKKETSGKAEGITKGAGRKPAHGSSASRGFRYFLQVHECPMPNKTKVKVSKWVDTPDLNRYEQFVNDWHYFLEHVQERVAQETDEEIRKINLLLLKLFYIKPYDNIGPYDERDFYRQFGERLAMAREVLDLA